MTAKAKSPQEQLVAWVKSIGLDRELRKVLISGARKMPDDAAKETLANMQRAATELTKFVSELVKERTLGGITSGAKEHEHADLAELRKCCMVNGELDRDLVTAHFTHLPHHKYYNGMSSCDNPCGTCSCGATHKCDSPMGLCSCGRMR